MPRVNHVKKARKDQGTCRCGKKLAKGEPYRWWKFRFGGKHKRCMDCKIRPSDLTNSKMGAIWDAQEDVSNAISSWDGKDVPELSEAISSLAETVREVAEEYMEGVEAQREHFPNGNPVMEENEEKAQELDSWADELESLESEVEDFDEDAAVEEVKDEIREELEADPKYEITDDWEPEEVLVVEGVAEKREVWAEEQRGKVESVVDECPV